LIESGPQFILELPLANILFLRLLFGPAKPFQCPTGEQGDADGAEYQISQHHQTVNNFQIHDHDSMIGHGLIFW
jgi:hypothetical protein